MMEIRFLTAQDDLNAVAELYAASWKTHYAGILPDAFLQKLTADRWTAMLHAEPEASLGLFENGIVVGTAMTAFCRDEGREGYGELVSLYLLPGMEGRGFGRRLLEAALQSLREEGCSCVCLWVMTENRRAIGFYEHMGFWPTGRFQQERYGGRDLQLMEMACQWKEHS